MDVNTLQKNALLQKCVNAKFITVYRVIFAPCYFHPSMHANFFAPLEFAQNSCIGGFNQVLEKKKLVIEMVKMAGGWAAAKRVPLLA